MEPELEFEAALVELEQIVGQLEGGEPALAEALARYERGIHLLAHCQNLLDGADRTVALLTGVDGNGQPLTTPFDTTATADRDRGDSPGPKTPKTPKPNDGIPF
ncbi:Exodeoxyribonuclease VII small subunit [Singulisphaera sp. GP187]|uniref:exodeoxyribonuclease VII small subunit n=1 Tax=Singulisphaera sp. GP187 TaxID=1882752 RepID=UPI000928E652|nr:Exodeoxyribonuclease VII small subunit [Singulisphaera sp. GP187]